MQSLENLDLQSIVALYDKLQIGIYITNKIGDVLYVNDYFVKLTGRSKQTLLSSNFLKHRSHYNTSVIEHVVSSGKVFSTFQDVNYPDLSFRQFITATPVFDSNGNISYIIAAVEGVLDHAKRLEMASQSNIHFANLSRSSDNTKERVSVIADSPQMQELLKLVDIVAPVYSSILIEGDSGTGKEVIVQLIHSHSNRNNKPLVAINCASLPENLLEAELFGYEKGAFTGASDKGKKGLLKEADGGTLFLDEINSMPLSIQGKMLRVLETKKVRPLGSTKEYSVDFRVVSATNVSLKNLCEQGKFREDLYYRLNVVPMVIPPLRERKEDIIPLVKFYLSQYESLYNKLINFSQEAYDQMLAYSWPGNIRELKNIVERVVVMNYSGTVQRIPDSVFSSEPDTKDSLSNPKMPAPDVHSRIMNSDFDLNNYLDSKEEEILRWCSEHFDTMAEIAEAMKIDRTSVGRKLKKYGITMSGRNK